MPPPQTVEKAYNPETTCRGGIHSAHYVHTSEQKKRKKMKYFSVFTTFLTRNPIKFRAA